MTAAEKEMVHQFRQDGLSCTQIASALSISVNTIKSYCRRYALPTSSTATVPGTEQEKSRCKQCGKRNAQNGRHRPRKFCSDACRRAWWKENEKAASAIYITACCSHCGMGFKSRCNDTHKYCSHGCYIADRFGGNAHEQRAV